MVNVSNPALPVLVGGSASNSVIDPKGLYATGSYLYVAVSYGSTNQFQVWDISNPSVWSNVNTVTISGGAPVFVTGGQSGYLYLLTQNANATSPLRIYRVTGSGGNMIYGDVVSSGASGSITKIHATSSLYAKTITNSLTDKNAYYQTISNTTVLGTSYPGAQTNPQARFRFQMNKLLGGRLMLRQGGLLPVTNPPILSMAPSLSVLKKFHAIYLLVATLLSRSLVRYGYLATLLFLTIR